MSEDKPQTGEDETESNEVFANPQPTSADKPPIPQPATDGVPAAGEDLTSRVPGEYEDVTKEK